MTEKKCPDAERTEYTCEDRTQCWEPCGELGKSEEHTRVYIPGQGLLDCGIEARPLPYPLHDYHTAISGGPLHYTWADKPHRLVYDLIAAVKYYAQPEQKPVAWGFQNSAITGSNRWMMLREEIPANDQYGGALWTPLYTTPPQRKPLTDVDWKARALKAEKAVEELAYAGFQRKPLTRAVLWKLWCDAKFESAGFFWLVFARAIEAAHGIKE